MGLLELAGVGKRYGRGRLERVALRDVSFELSRGELVAIWGRRNSGRSTLLRVAAGLEAPDQGVVSLDGRDLNARGGEALREQIRYVRKTYRATEGQLVVDRLVTAQLTRGIRGAQARARAHEALERTDASHCATLKPSELDIAETILVGVARSLVHQPELLVIDEPTLGVDASDRDRILSLLRGLADEGVSVLMSVGETTGLSGADRALSLADGELHGELQPAELAPVVQLRAVSGRAVSA
ncbi:MAG TPA: ATP-binding cassette domain-containing protein [Solirubrobacteraceae bacterium]|jgi:ABC-type multidrug transport system ATPase subunit|nr:ATP-binding cassette domain-containing protein [Solirubrobacteraceae bacterium]